MGCLLLVVFHPLASLSFSFIGGVWKKVKYLREHPQWSSVCDPTHLIYKFTTSVRDGAGLDEEKFKHAGLWLSKMGFCPASFADFAESSKRHSKQTCAPAREECNKYDLTAAPCFRFVDHDDWSRWFVSSSTSPPCLCLQSQF